MDILLEGFEQGKTTGTWRVLDGGATPAPGSSALAIDNKDGTVSLPKTGHRVPIAVLGEGIFTYFIRVAAAVAGNPNAAAGIQQSADMYNVGKTGDPRLDLAVQADAYANPSAYAISFGGGGGSDAQQQATLQPGAIDVRTMNLQDLKWLCVNLRAVMNNHGTTHGPMAALNVLAGWLDAGIADAGNGQVVAPAGFPQLGALTVAEAQDLRNQYRASL